MTHASREALRTLTAALVAAGNSRAAILANCVEAGVEELAVGAREAARTHTKAARVALRLNSSAILALKSGARVNSLGAELTGESGRTHAAALVAVGNRAAAVLARIDKAGIEGLKYWTYIV